VLELLLALEQPARACLAAAAVHGSSCYATLRTARTAAEQQKRRLAVAEGDAAQRDVKLVRALKEAAALRDEVQKSSVREASVAALHAIQVSNAAVAMCPNIVVPMTLVCVGLSPVLTSAEPDYDPDHVLSAGP
jgi:hypothetical protein